MSETVTLEHIGELVAQLPTRDQLRLVAKVSERLSHTPQLDDEERDRREYQAQVEAFLKMCDELAAECLGGVDSAEDLRQIREERASCI